MRKIIVVLLIFMFMTTSIICSGMKIFTKTKEEEQNKTEHSKSSNYSIQTEQANREIIKDKINDTSSNSNNKVKSGPKLCLETDHIIFWKVPPDPYDLKLPKHTRTASFNISNSGTEILKWRLNLDDDELWVVLCAIGRCEGSLRYNQKEEITMHVRAPPEPNGEWNGIIGIESNGGYAEVQVTLKTSGIKTKNTFVNQFLNKFIQNFPILTKLVPLIPELKNL